MQPTGPFATVSSFRRTFNKDVVHSFPLASSFLYVISILNKDYKYLSENVIQVYCTQQQV